MKHKLESRLQGEISITKDKCRWHHPYGRKWRGTKKPLGESERGEWKSWLKAQHSKNKDHDLITSWQIDGETMEIVTDFIFFGSKITADGDCSHKIMTSAPWKESYDQPRQHTLPTKVSIV